MDSCKHCGHKRKSNFTIPPLERSDDDDVGRTPSDGVSSGGARLGGHPAVVGPAVIGETGA